MPRKHSPLNLRACALWLLPLAALCDLVWGLLARDARGPLPSAPSHALDAAERAKVEESYGRLPLSFEANEGQVAGVRLAGGSSSVQGCYIGTDAAGTAAIPNGTTAASGWGVLVNPSFNNILGVVAASRNVISGNTSSGGRVVGPGALNNSITSRPRWSKPSSRPSNTAGASGARDETVGSRQPAVGSQDNFRFRIPDERLTVDGSAAVINRQPTQALIQNLKTKMSCPPAAYRLPPTAYFFKGDYSP